MHIGAKQVNCPAVVKWTYTAQMWRDNEVGSLPERAVGRQRFFGENVYRCSGDHLLLESFFQSGKVSDAAAAQVDKIGCGFHGGKFFSAEHVTGGSRKWDGYHHKITFLEHRVEGFDGVKPGKEITVRVARAGWNIPVIFQLFQVAF